jgi:hypothetical protein
MLFYVDDLPIIGDNKKIKWVQNTLKRLWDELLDNVNLYLKIEIY